MRDISSPVTHFLRRLGVFVLGMAMPLAGIEAILRSDPHGNCYAAKAHALERISKQVEVLFLGSSHMEHAIDPSLIALSSFNLAHPSETVAESCTVSCYWLNRLPRLNVVVLSISYFSLEMLGETPEWWRHRFYVHYYGAPTESYSIGDWISRYSLLYTYGFGHLRVPLEDAIQAALHQPVSDAYSTSGAYLRKRPPVQPAALMRLAEPRAALHRKYMKAANRRPLLNDLRGLATLLARRNIALVLVTTPVTPRYADLMTGPEWQYNLDSIRRLCRETGAVYLDFSRDARFDYADFTDPDHLNHVGAARFTRMLAAVLATQKRTPR